MYGVGKTWIFYSRIFYSQIFDDDYSLAGGGGMFARPPRGYHVVSYDYSILPLLKASVPYSPPSATGTERKARRLRMNISNQPRRSAPENQHSPPPPSSPIRVPQQYGRYSTALEPSIGLVQTFSAVQYKGETVQLSRTGMELSVHQR